MYTGNQCSVTVLLNRLSREGLTEYRRKGDEGASLLVIYRITSGLPRWH